MSLLRDGKRHEARQFAAQLAVLANKMDRIIVHEVETNFKKKTGRSKFLRRLFDAWKPRGLTPESEGDTD